MNYVDLHVHSTYSDGTYSPAQLVELAQKQKVSHFALTDHDTINGILPALEASQNTSVTVIPGVELSSEHNKKDIHIVGLWIDYHNLEFLNYLTQFQQDRYNRNVLMCEKLVNAGFDIPYEKVREAYPDAVITRCHIGKYLAQKGYIDNLWQAFDLYIGDDCPYFVPREKFTPAQAVGLIKKAGGIAVLAHPLLYHLSHAELCELIEQLKQFGLDAIEAIYSCNKKGDEAYVRSLAKTYGLKISGGSDFHGKNKPNIQLGTGKGNVHVTEEMLQQLSP